MNIIQKISIITNVILFLLVLGFLFSFKVVGIILLCILGLRIMSTPSVFLYYLWNKYKQLRQHNQSILAFFVLIQDQLKQIDEMQITDLRVVNLKQKIKILRQTMKNKKR